MRMPPFLNALLDFVFPSRCPLCGQFLSSETEQGICVHCVAQIRPITSPLCTVCGKPFYSERADDHLCGECLTTRRYFTRARAMGYYDGILREAIHLLKYRLKYNLAAPLGRLLVQYMRSYLDEVHAHLIIPVPLHPRRLRERGFNQALSLAGMISKMRGIPLERFALTRIRWTAPQVGLREEERTHNVRGAFALAGEGRVRNKNILLIDDVYTSGSTVEECAKVLRKGGARKVEVLTLARVS